MKKIHYTSLISVVLLQLAFYSVLHRNLIKDIEGELWVQNAQADIKVKSAINTYTMVSELAFTQIINQEEILSLYSKAYTADSATQASIRNELYHKLVPVYQQLKSQNIKQLHFHLPDNTSFLRFHRPSRFGDDLTNHRYSVKMANLEKKRYNGFEEGRINNGFRYVFPLSYKNQHIGTVETGFSFEAIRTLLEMQGNPYSTLILPRSVVQSTVFKEELNNYDSTLISTEYMVENAFSHYTIDTTGLLQTIEKKIQPKLVEKFKQHKNFSTYTQIGKQFYTINFISIENLKKNHVAYIITYQPNQHIQQITKRHKLFLGLGLTIIPLIVIFIILYIDNHQKVKNQNIRLTESINQLNLRTVELQELSIQLQKLIDDKNLFIRILAHDLKNPFNELMTMSGLMISRFRHYEPDEIEQQLTNFHHTAKQTYNLLEDLLLWSKSQAGNLPFEPQVYLFNFICKQAYSGFTPNTKNISIDCLVSDDIRIYVDLNMFRAIMRNLISNAIKFTHPNGRITISADYNQDVVTICVSDNGIGIPEENISKLWQYTRSLTTPGTEGETGTGLGLTLCKVFVEKHGGKIGVNSRVGEGSTFYFTIPSTEV